MVVEKKWATVAVERVGLAEWVAEVATVAVVVCHVVRSLRNLRHKNIRKTLTQGRHLDTRR